MSFQKTPIEYLTHTWNPITMRCTPVSEGCRNCWHIRRAEMFTTNPKISYLSRRRYKGDIPPIIRTGALHIPKGSGRRIGVQFMGDLFHETVSNDMIDQIILAIAFSHKDTFVILTKRPKRMLEFEQVSKYGFPENAWVGVTVENNDNLSRIDELLKIRAAVRWVSAEPMLGLINFDNGPLDPESTMGNWSDLDQLDWVVCGAETGPGKRPMNTMWAVDLLAQCHEAGVPFFFKKDSNGKYDPNFPREWPRAKDFKKKA